VDVSPDGQRAISGSLDGTMKLWRISDGQCLRTFTGHAGWVRTVTFFPNGTQAMSTSSDSTLKHWDLETGECLRTFYGHTGPVCPVLISPDGLYALSASWDKTVRLWRIADSECLRIYTGHTQRICALTWLDGELASVSPGAGSPEVRLLSSHPNPFRSETRIQFSLPQGTQADLAIYDLRGRVVRRLISGHKPAGNHIATWYGDDSSDRPVSHGIYFIRLQARNRLALRKVVLVR
jgi:WD40 repeat protein